MPRGPRRDEAAGGPRRVAGRPCLHLHGVGGLAPTALGLRPQAACQSCWRRSPGEASGRFHAPRRHRPLATAPCPPPDPAAARSPPGDRPAPPPRALRIRTGTQPTSRMDTRLQTPARHQRARQPHSNQHTAAAGGGSVPGWRPRLLVPLRSPPPGEKPHA